MAAWQGGDLRLVPAAALCWAAAAWWTEADSTVSLVAAVMAAVVAGARRSVPWVAVTAVFLAAVATSCAWRIAQVERSPVTEAAQAHRAGHFELTVRGDAVTFDRHGHQQSVVEVVVNRMQIVGDSRDVHVIATAFLDDSGHDLVVGRSFTAVGRLEPSETRQQAAVIDVARRSPASSGSAVWEGADRVRDGVRTAAAPMPPGPRALLPALVDGDTSQVSDEMETDFQRTGLTHLMAVSGTNLTIVLGLVLVGTRLSRAGRVATWTVAALTIAAFIAVARPDPSVIRAAAMGAVGVAALGFGRRGGVRALSVAIVALLFIDPWLSRSAGFILSVSATAGILVLGPPFTQRLARWLPQWLAMAVAIPFAAQVACTPTIAAISGEVSLVAVLANLVAGPVVAPATVFGLIGGAVAVASPTAGQVIAWPAGACAAWIVEVAERGATLAGAAIAWTVPWQLLLVAVPAVTVACWYAAARPVLAVGLTLGLTAGLIRPPSPGWPPPGWVMVACDVGQGDATVLNAGNGAAVVVDAGPDDESVDACLNRLGVDRVMLFIATHEHADHVGGTGAIDAELMVGGPSSKGLAQASVGNTFQAGEVFGRVVWPAAGPSVESDPEGQEGSAVNDASLVVRAEVNGVSILLTGDIEPAAQDALLRSGQRLDADVLKMPHHGSARQSPRFLDAVGATVATISVGADNDYGHPAPAAMTMLAERHVSAWRTDLNGDIAVVRRGQGALAVVTRR